MKLAIPYENGLVFQHFGHSQKFKIYVADKGEICSETVLDTLGSGHGALAGFLADLKVDVLICGGIGGGAKNALAQVGIRVFGGVSGNADQAAAAFLAGSLNFNPNATCSHHAHGEDHDCSDHDCGSHTCGKGCH